MDRRTVDHDDKSMRKAIMKVLRLYADDSGESHFDTHEIAMTLQDFAPPAAPLYISEAQAATRYVVIRLPLGWGGEPHPSPSRQMLFCLSGSFRVSASDGESRSVAAGDALLLADTSGKGHSTSVTSDTLSPP